MFFRAEGKVRLLANSNLEFPKIWEKHFFKKQKHVKMQQNTTLRHLLTIKVGGPIETRTLKTQPTFYRKKIILSHFSSLFRKKGLFLGENKKVQKK